MLSFMNGMHVSCARGLRSENGISNYFSMIYSLKESSGFLCNRLVSWRWLFCHAYHSYLSDHSCFFCNALHSKLPVHVHCTESIRICFHASSEQANAGEACAASVELSVKFWIFSLSCTSFAKQAYLVLDSIIPRTSISLKLFWFQCAKLV